jgi:high-affinity iron transporter
MILITAILTASLLTGPRPADQGDQAPTVRRIAATTALAAEEYGVGVRDGRVVAPAEVEEARLFLTEARRSAAVLPPDASRSAVAAIDGMLVMVGRVAPPDSVAERARILGVSLAAQFGVTLDEIPEHAPQLAQGAALYRAQCASCHGPLGRGDGPAAAALTPPPADLSDFRRLADATPLDFYRRITIGVTGTAMPAFEGRLSADERWATALYATALRLPAARGEVPAALRTFATTARMSDAELAGLIPGGDIGVPTTRSWIAAVRTAGATDGMGANAALVFSGVRQLLDSSMNLARAGDPERSSAVAFDAYMRFEEVERGVRAKNAGLANALEAGFAALRTRAAGGASPPELGDLRSRLLADLENAERTLVDRLSPFNLFVQSFILLLREGLEAILVVGALVAFLLKTGAGHRRRDIHIGVGAAVGASLVTAVLLETILEVGRTSQEALEGGIMLVATAMLFYVSYWLLSKMEVARWNRFVRGRVQDAVTSGSALALASVAFLAVYREGFETVLFYKALFLAGAGSALPVFLGMVAGGACLGIVYFAINRWGVKIPLKPFFAVTSAFLYYMAFVFAGRGVAELQEGGVIPTTVVSWGPRLPALGISPTVESLALQGVLLLLLATALVWTFAIEPRRLRVTSQLVPEATASAPLASPAAAKAPARVEGDILRSLERMDADLAELRAEVERLKSMLTQSPSRSR